MADFIKLGLVSTESEILTAAQAQAIGQRAIQAKSNLSEDLFAKPTVGIRASAHRSAKTLGSITAYRTAKKSSLNSSHTGELSSPWATQDATVFSKPL